MTENEEFKTTENCIYEKCLFNENFISHLLNILVKHQIQSVIIEGGSKTIQSFIDLNLWDEARIFIGENVFIKGTKAPNIKGNLIQKSTILNDKLLILANND